MVIICIIYANFNIIIVLLLVYWVFLGIYTLLVVDYSTDILLICFVSESDITVFNFVLKDLVLCF